MANTVKDFASPNGPILLLSAKGLTTAGIAEADGVKDFSGNGNHGQAFGGVSVLDGGEGFGFGTGYFAFTSSGFLSNFTGLKALTITCRIVIKSFNDTDYVIGLTTPGPKTFALSYTRSGIDFGGRWIDQRKWESAIYAHEMEINKEYAITGVADFENGQIFLFVNGEKVAEKTDATAQVMTSCSGVSVGNIAPSASPWYPSNADIKDIRFYPRALSAAEVKYLHGGFQPNLIMGQPIPSGAILDLSARGLTTAGIAQANGVVDRSGNGNHGQAYNGVAVVNDDEMGSCFSFDGTGYLSVEALKTALNGTKAVTLHITVFFDNLDSQQGLIVGTSNNAANVGSGLIYHSTKKVRSAYRINPSDSASFVDGITTLVSQKWYCFTTTIDFEQGINRLYINGILDIESTTGNGGAISYNFGNFTIGRQGSTYALKGKISNTYVYTRALTASEVQQLANASLKKIRGVSMGSELIKHIYYGSSLVYAKTDDYTYNGTPTEVSFKIHQLNSSSKRNTIEYTGNNANFASITYPNNVCDMGDWPNWINDHFTPVMLKSNGTVDYELNRDNLNYKSDGSTPSDVANTSYDGNAMLQIKKFYISIASTTEDSHEVFNVSISDTKKDSSYTCYGFIDKDGNEQDYAYYGLFHGYIDANNKLRSKAGVTLSSFTNQGNFSTMRTAAINNGSGWDISNYALENAIGLVLMMLYKDVNPMFVHQDSSNNYRETSTTPYATTGALATSGGFPWTTTSTMPKALWIESYWRNAAIPGLACNIWINGLGSLKNSTNASGFGIYYKLTPPYDLSTPSLWTYMSNTIPYIYVSNAHQIQDVTVYENLLFPKGNGPDAVGGSSGMVSAYYNRFWGGGDINGGLSTSYHSNTTEIKPVKNGFYRALNQWTAPPHYLCYNAFGSSTRSEHVNGSARLTYLKNSN